MSAPTSAPTSPPPLLPHPPLVWLWRELRWGVPLCLAVALFLWLLLGGGFGRMVVYSLCVGLSIQALIEGGRYGLAGWLHRRRPGSVAADSYWPGWRPMGPWVAFSAVAGYVIGVTLGGWLTGTSGHGPLLGGNLRALAVVMAVTLAVSLGTTFFFFARGSLAALALQAQEQQKATAEARLKLLQSQLEPHMLFNTLANLRVLIATDPPQAQAMLDRLIAFLRATLDASRADAHTLRDEFARVADYLALMAMRMGTRLEVRLELPRELEPARVPPLLLQPLVENAIRHGLEPKMGAGRLECRAGRDADTLVLEVRDTGVGLAGAPGGAPTSGGGFGLEQVHSRLAALHGPAASLTLEAAGDGEGGVRARIRLPLALVAPGAAGAASGLSTTGAASKA